MLISDEIAKMINELLETHDGILELQRNDMAQQLGCAPSQINYVISSRFTPRHGYLIESRRGGGGYIRIVRKEIQSDEYLMHFFHAIGDRLTEAEAYAMIRNLCENKLLPPRVASALASATSSTALIKITEKENRDAVRADILRQLILSQMK